MDRRRIQTFVVGGLVGALAGILLAPRSGRELRGSISNRTGEARERSRETYLQAYEKMQGRVSEAREGSRRAGRSPIREEPVVDETSFEPTGGAYGGPDRPPLRDVSRGVYENDAGEPVSGERADELRKKVRETRARLRERLEGGGDSGATTPGGEKDEPE